MGYENEILRWIFGRKEGEVMEEKFKKKEVLHNLHFFT